MTAPVSQVLSEAADLLEKPGAWGQGLYQSHDGCMCPLGALARASKVSPYGNWDNVSKTLPYEAATLAFGGVNHTIEYNDAPERTQTEVVDALRRAAALAKEQGR